MNIHGAHHYSRSRSRAAFLAAPRNTQ
jgi:hypothetical protein